MKRTQMIEALRNIRRNRVSFLSIVIISMLAVTAYLGLSFSAEGLKKSADATYEAEQQADIEINGSVPFTDKDLDAASAAEGVADAEGILAVPSRVISGFNIQDIELRSVSERISLPRLLEGSLPQAEEACAIEKTLASRMGYQIGDQLQLTGRSPAFDALIQTKTYTVCGIFTSADHLTEMVTFEPQILVTRSAFSAMLPRGTYTRLLVRTAAEPSSRFSTPRKEFTDGVQRRIEAISDPWIVTALHHTASFVCTEEDAGILSTISVTFSMLFVLIAALVIYSTISRLVEHESRLVGATKAIGLKNSEIFAKYLLFGAGGAFSGAVIGILFALLFERIVQFFFGTVFILGKWVLAFQPVPVIIVTAGSAALGLAAVFLACTRLLRSTAVSLMNGQNAGRRARKNTSAGEGALYIKLMLRNMRTDWKRVCVSIVSIAGCCMLLLIGFSLKYAISRVPDRQYEQIQRYDMEIETDPSALPGSMESIRVVLAAENVPNLCVYTNEIPYKADGEPGMLTLICPEDSADLSDYFQLMDAQSGSALSLPERGVLVTRMFARQYHLAAGDAVILYDSGMNPHEAEIAGVFENYIGILAVCKKTYAEECLGTELPAGTVLLHLGHADPEALRQQLKGIGGFISLTSARKQQALFDGLSTMLNLVILLLGALAVMIACFILLNLVSTYVSQKKNELTIMRINGYTTGETIRYASMECYGITALGILLGLAAGQVFCSFLIRLIEQLTMSFVRDPLWISFAASAAITAVISGVIHFLAFRKIRGLKLSDIQR